MEILSQEGYAFLSRYAHILAGITWIGLLYYFNFVQVPAFAEMSGEGRSEAMRRGHLARTVVVPLGRDVHAAHGHPDPRLQRAAHP